MFVFCCSYVRDAIVHESISYGMNQLCTHAQPIMYWKIGSNPFMSELSNTITDTFTADLILGTTIILIQDKKPAELYKVCYKCYYKHA